VGQGHEPRPLRRRLISSRDGVAALLAALLALAAAGCGGGGGTHARPATVILDFTPNAVHSGIYLAHARGYDRDEGVDLHVQVPSSSTDSVKLLLSGRAPFAILDIHDLAIARQDGRDIVGVMALVERPLAAVLAQPAVARPRDLAGRRAGVTGLPSDDAVLASIVRGDGGDPTRVRRVTIGFDAVPALLARRVAAATAFWNVEGVALRAKRPAVREFRVDSYGAPPYPELVLCVSRATLRRDSALVRATVAALERGYGAAVADPRAAVKALVAGAGGLDGATATAQMNAVRAALRGGEPHPGVLDPAVLRRWAAWEARFGIVRRRPDVARGFATALSRDP
jgi:ABC-type nitrate/sulfonate/bicarbonate transport system substrate-binding protein